MAAAAAAVAADAAEVAVGFEGGVAADVMAGDKDRTSDARVGGAGCGGGVDAAGGEVVVGVG